MPAQSGRPSVVSGPSPRVLTLGSCRVHDPIRAAMRARGTSFEIDDLRLANTPYFHTAHANLQLLQMFCGIEPVKPAAYPLVFLEGKYRPPHMGAGEAFRARLADVDVILLEICEQSDLVSGGTVLHSNEVHRYLVTGRGQAAEAWWAAVVGGKRSEHLITAMLVERGTGPDAVSVETIELLRSIRLVDRKAEDIATAIVDLQRFASRPVCVVPHIDCIGTDGQPIARRRAFVATVRKAAELAQVPVFQPDALIAEFGQDRVLAQQGRDSHHYDAAFLTVAGQRMIEFVAERIASPARVARAPRVLVPPVMTASLLTRPMPTESGDVVSGRSLISMQAHPPIANSPAADPSISALEQKIVAILAHRLGALGETESGLGPYYANRIRAGHAFGANDRVLLEHLKGGYGEFAGVVEAGAGYGQLGMALAATQGRQVICIEVDGRRFAAMEALLAGLVSAYPILQENVALRRGAWPDVIQSEDPSMSLLVAEDFVYSGPPEAEAKAIAGLRRHGGALIDATNFVRKRATEPERAEFFAKLRAAGFGEPSLLSKDGTRPGSQLVFVRPS